VFGGSRKDRRDVFYCFSCNALTTCRYSPCLCSTFLLFSCFSRVFRLFLSFSSSVETRDRVNNGRLEQGHLRSRKGGKRRLFSVFLITSLPADFALVTSVVQAEKTEKTSLPLFLFLSGHASPCRFRSRTLRQRYRKDEKSVNQGPYLSGDVPKSLPKSPWPRPLNIN